MEQYGYIKDGKVFRKGFLSFEDREIGEVKKTDEEALEYFSKRFDKVHEKLAQLEDRINEATNKGSFLGQLLHLKTSLAEFDALGDYISVFMRLDILEEQLQSSINNNRVKNLEIKTALLTELKVLAASKEWKSASHLVKELQTKWRKTGAVAEEHKEEIEGTYEALIQGFYDNRAAFYSDLDKMMKDREQSFEEFLKKAEGLKSIKNLDKLRTEIRSYKEEWKTLGRIKQDVRDKHWETFQAIIQSALDVAKKESKKNKKDDHKANFKARQAFVERLSTIAQDINQNYNVDSLKSEWSSLGPVSKKDIESLRPEYGRWIMILSEAKFVDSLARKKSKKGISKEDFERVKFRVARDLLERDKRELQTFNENLGNFSTAKGLDKIIGDKLELQEKKVAAKQYVLDQLRKKK